MSEWRETTLGEVCDISSSKRIFAKEYQDYGIPFYRGKEIIEKYKGIEISTELFIAKERFQEIKTKFGVPITGDILLTSVGTLGIPYLVKEEEFYFKDGNLTWFKNFVKVDSGFLFYWLVSPFALQQIDGKCIGSTQKALTIDTLKQFTISLPPLPEQKAIADTLSGLDDKIESNNKINQTLEEMAQAIFKSWFVDFEPFGGEMPEDWEVGTLSDVANLNKNSYSSKENWEFVNYLDTSSITKGIISEIQYLNSLEDKVPSRAKRKVISGDVIYSTVRPNQLHYGFIDEPVENMLVSTGFCVITALENRSFEKIFLHLTQTEITEKLQQLGEQSTSTYPAIKADDIGVLEYVIPPVSIEKDFKDLVSPIFLMIAKNQKENQTLTEIRNTLLPKLMSGEVRLPLSTAVDIPLREGDRDF